MFSGKQVPAVGVSLGIERVFAIKEQQAKDRNQVNIFGHNPDSCLFAIVMENSLFNSFLRKLLLPNKNKLSALTRK